MDILASITVFVLLPYLIWATVISDNFFHRVWSLALVLCAALQLSLRHLALSIQALCGIVPIQLVLVVFCVALSPVQKYFHKTRPFDHKALEVLWPGRSSDDIKQEIFIDVVAIHGLASDPRTAWQNRSTNDVGIMTAHPEWLRDFLPEEGLHARIMTFNHNTEWRANALGKSLYDHGADLIRGLQRNRKTDEEKHRPIVSIGHVFRGLIVKQAIKP